MLRLLLTSRPVSERSISALPTLLLFRRSAMATAPSATPNDAPPALLKTHCCLAAGNRYSCRAVFSI